MSGILLPLIRSSRTTGDAQPINVDKIINFNKLTIPPTPNSTKTLYKIVFSMDAGMNPKEVVWNYTTQVDMDNDFTSLLTLTSGVTV